MATYTIPVMISNDQVLLRLDINGNAVAGLFDTGSNTPLVISGNIANIVNAPNLGPVVLGSASGTADGYWTELPVKIGDCDFGTVKAIVNPQLPVMCLVGFPLLKNTGHMFLLDRGTSTLTFGDSVFEIPPIPIQSWAQDAVDWAVGRGTLALAPGQTVPLLNKEEQRIITWIYRLLR